MNEEYIKHLMKENKGETPFQLWMQFIALQFLWGLLLIGLVGIYLMIAS